MIMMKLVLCYLVILFCLGLMLGRILVKWFFNGVKERDWVEVICIVLLAIFFGILVDENLVSKSGIKDKKCVELKHIDNHNQKKSSIAIVNWMAKINIKNNKRR